MKKLKVIRETKVTDAVDAVVVLVVKMTKLKDISQFTAEKTRLRLRLSTQSLYKMRLSNQNLRKKDSQKFSTVPRLQLLLVNSRWKSRRNRRFAIDQRVLDQLMRKIQIKLRPKKRQEASLVLNNNNWFIKEKMKSIKKRLNLRIKTAKIQEENLRVELRVELIVVRMMRKIRNPLNSLQYMKSIVLGIGEDQRKREYLLLWRPSFQLSQKILLNTLTRQYIISNKQNLMKKLMLSTSRSKI